MADMETLARSKPAIESPKYSDRAACRGLPVELWFPEVIDEEELVAFAVRGVPVSIEDREGQSTHGHSGIRVCAECPVAVDCAMWAVLTGEQHGIWGGMGAEGKLKWLRVTWARDGDVDAILALVEVELGQIRRSFGIGDAVRDWVGAGVCHRCGDHVPAGRWPPDRNSEGATCGNAVTFVKGCRCFRCRCANAVRQLRY